MASAAASFAAENASCSRQKLGNRTSRKCRDWRAAGERLGHDKAKRLVPARRHEADARATELFDKFCPGQVAQINDIPA